MMRKRLFLSILSILTALCGTGFGETLVLKHGGRVEGSILNRQAPKSWKRTEFAPEPALSWKSLPIR